jgi:16S rRNA (cytidine1402-2'-O)-methyltransferase
MTLVFYESPRRIVGTLKDIRDLLGERHVVVTRELTKLFEEVIRGRAGDVIGKLESGAVKGEITLLVEGEREKPLAGDGEIEALYGEMDPKGELSTKEIAAMIAAELDLPRKRVYDKILKLRASREEGEKVTSQLLLEIAAAKRVEDSGKV